MIKACIFDLDGTLMDTVASIARPINKTLEFFGLQPRPVEEYNFYAGDGMDTAVRRALAAAGDPEGIHAKEGIPLCRKWFGEDPLYQVKPYAHMKDVLDELKNRGIKITVFSNKPHEAAIDVVNTIFGKGYFDWIQGQTDLIPKKPDPSGAIQIMKILQVSKEECLYFGDTNTDMKTGLGAGICTVGVTWGFRPRKELEENHADRIIDSPMDIIRLVEEYSR